MRRYLLAGLVVWLPILVTFVVMRFIIDLLDRTLALLPASYQPDALFGVHLPGLGVVLSLVLLFITGIVATNFFGERLVQFGEAILAKIPLVRSVYNTSKQIISAVFATNGQAFSKVLLVEYPRKGLWSVAFLTGSSSPAMNDQMGNEMLSIFIPTTPNPTAGFLMMIPKSEAIELSMTVDEALTFIVSLGLMQPMATPAASLEK